jgi:hypothetical protein
MDVPAGGRQSDVLAPVFARKTWNASHMRDVGGHEDSTSGKRVRCDCNVEVFDAIAPPLERRFDDPEMLANLICPHAATELTAHQLELRAQ